MKIILILILIILNQIIIIIFEEENLETQLNILLKEKDDLENDLLKLPDKPRILKDIKPKKEKNERIKKIDEKIEIIKKRIKQEY